MNVLILPQEKWGPFAERAEEIVMWKRVVFRELIIVLRILLLLMKQGTLVVTVPRQGIAWNPLNAMAPVCFALQRIMELKWNAEKQRINAM
jgi:hypothetical protein